MQAELWLVEPFYPLPGEPPIKTLPNDPAPLLVEACYKTKKPSYAKAQKRTRGKNPDEVSLPVITQDSLMGVLHATRQAENPFSAADIEILKQLIAVAALAMQVNRRLH